MKEIWKDIKGYEGYYQVSNLGNIKGLLRVVNQSHGGEFVSIFSELLYQALETMEY